MTQMCVRPSVRIFSSAVRERALVHVPCVVLFLAHLFNCGEKFQFDYKLNKWFNQLCVCVRVFFRFIFFLKFKKLQTISLNFCIQMFEDPWNTCKRIRFGPFQFVDFSLLWQKRNESEKARESERKKHFVCTGKKRSIFNTYYTCIHATTQEMR